MDDMTQMHIMRGRRWTGDVLINGLSYYQLINLSDCSKKITAVLRQRSWLAILVIESFGEYVKVYYDDDDVNGESFQ